MNKVLFLASLLLLFIFNTVQAKESLVFSLDLIRHGDRAPLISLPKIPYTWKEEKGELTEKGAIREEELGKKLRTYYIENEKFLPKKFSADTVYVRTTDVGRVIKSASFFLKGLYPHDYKNIPINSIPKKDDTVLRYFISSDSTDQKNLKEYEEKLLNRYLDALGARAISWENLTGHPVKDLLDIDFFGDYLSVASDDQMDIPLEGAALTENDRAEMIHMGHQVLLDRFNRLELAGPMGRNFLKLLKNNISQVVETKSSLKYVLLMGHDTSLLSVLTTLGVPSEKSLPYASRLNFSVIEENGLFYMKTTINNESLALPQCLFMLRCPLSLFTAKI